MAINISSLGVFSVHHRQIQGREEGTADTLSPSPNNHSLMVIDLTLT